MRRRNSGEVEAVQVLRCRGCRCRDRLRVRLSRKEGLAWRLELGLLVLGLGEWQEASEPAIVLAEGLLRTRPGMIGGPVRLGAGGRGCGNAGIAVVEETLLLVVVQEGRRDMVHHFIASFVPIV